MFHIAERLYRDGYDVHPFDEDAVARTGAGPAYDEVVSAIQNRGVREVAIFGYSHGGGSTHDLAYRLNTNRSSIGNFTIAFTAYVDAIRNAWYVGLKAEERRPPGTAFHMNYYQHARLLSKEVGLDACSTAGVGADYELDVETTTWAPVRHTTP